MSIIISNVSIAIKEKYRLKIIIKIVMANIDDGEYFKTYTKK
jgi:hypothetical protein